MPSPKRRNHDVQDLRPFKDTNKYARNEANGRLYVVYSYRDTWPMFIYDRQTGMWYETENKYSVTTSRHRTQCHPYCDTQKRDVEWMRASVRGLTEQEQIADLAI